MKKNMDLREHDRARFAREQLLNVKEEQRMASLAKTDCEERIRLLMEELQEKQKEQESLDEDMMSSAKKAKYLEEQIKRRDTALKKKTPKSDRATRKRSASGEEPDAHNSIASANGDLDTIRDVIREEIRAEMAAQLAPLKDAMNWLKAEQKKTASASSTCKCQERQDPEAEKRSRNAEDRARSILPLDKDEHVKEAVNDPEMRRAVTLLMRKEIPLEKARNQMMMIRKFLFADTYLLIRNFKRSGPTNMFALPCSLTPLLQDVYNDVIRNSVSRDVISSADDFITKFRISVKNSTRFYRMKGAMLEGQLSPFYENRYNIDAENDDTHVINPIISGEENLFTDVVDQDKMDPTWQSEENDIEQKSRRRTRRQVKLETESESVKPSPSPLILNYDDEIINSGGDMTTENFEEETPAPSGPSAPPESY